jgi:hypothetical protein
VLLPNISTTMGVTSSPSLAEREISRPPSNSGQIQTGPLDWIYNCHPITSFLAFRLG